MLGVKGCGCHSNPTQDFLPSFIRAYSIPPRVCLSSSPPVCLSVSLCGPPLIVCLCVSVVVNHSEKMSARMWSCPSGGRRPATSLNDFCPAVLPACWDTLTIYQIKHLMHLWAIKAQRRHCRHGWPKCARIRLHNTHVFPKWSCRGLDKRHLWQRVEAWARPAWCAGDQEEETHVEFVVDIFKLGRTNSDFFLSGPCEVS